MLRPAKCGLDLGDGSERAEYVDQDYILQTLGRPHRNINIRTNPMDTKPNSLLHNPTHNPIPLTPPNKNKY